MNPQQTDNQATDTPEVVTSPLVGKISSAVENPFTGKKQKMTGHYSLPLALNMDDLASLTKGNQDDVLFWFNHGRKMAARAQVAAKLDFDLGNDDLNDLYRSFKNALNNMVDDKTPEPKRKRVIDFILGEDKFADLKTAMDSWKPEDITIDFSSTELRKPSGKRGRPGAKADESGEESES